MQLLKEKKLPEVNHSAKTGAPENSNHHEEADDVQGDITLLLHHLGETGLNASEDQIKRVYAELKHLASLQLRMERPDHTLQPTALVNEAYMRLIGHGRWANRAHFFRVASKVMRQVLVDHARARRAKKRGGDEFVVQFAEGLPEPAAPQGSSADEMIALDEALSALAKHDARQAQIVEMRYFGGLSENEICEILKIAPRTARRDWNFARAWLYSQLKGRAAGAH